MNLDDMERTCNAYLFATDGHVSYVCEMPWLHEISPTIPNICFNKNVQTDSQNEHNNTRLNSAAFSSLELDSADQDLHWHFIMGSGRHDENDVLWSEVSLALEVEPSHAMMENKSYPLEDIKFSSNSISTFDTSPTWPSTSSIPPASKCKVVKNKFSRMIHHFWMIEVISCLISFLCLGLIILVFLAYDGKKQETHGIYSGLPTTTVNILITLMRTAMVLPVGTALAQLQWSWFKTEQQLADMETFADATRGPFGSMILLSKMSQRRFWHFASIGAILTILSLPLESVVIHALAVPMKGDPLPDKDVDQGIIGVYRTNRYEWALPLSNDARLEDRVPPPSITAAIHQGITRSVSYGQWGNAIDRMLSPNCTTGFCNYPHYQSLGISVTCEDVGSHVVTTELQYSLPANDGLENELTLGLEEGLINTTVSFLYPDNAWFRDAPLVGPLVANIFILTNMLNETIATECALYWSITDYWSNTTNRDWVERYRELVIAGNRTSILQAAIHPEEGRDIIMNVKGSACWINGTQISSSDQEVNATLKDDCTFFITASAQKGLQNWLKSPIHGFVGSLSADFIPSNTFVTVLDTLFRERKDHWPTISDKIPSMSAWLRNVTQFQLFTPFTQTVTASIRTLPRGALLGIHTWGQLSAGTMYDSFRFRVLWPIMIFPVVLVLGSAVFTALVAVRARDHLWKKSSLPFVFFGLGRGVGEYVDMVEEAKGMRVRLEMGEGGMRLVEVGGGDECGPGPGDGDGGKERQDV